MTYTHDVKEYNKDINTVSKGEIITLTERTYFDDYKEHKLELRVDRVNKNTISVTCISGYMVRSSWKITKR